MTRFTWNLGAGYLLTTDHPASSYGVPVLVQVGSERFFGPCDIVPDEGCEASELAGALADGCDQETFAAVVQFQRAARVLECERWARTGRGAGGADPAATSATDC